MSDDAKKGTGYAPETEDDLDYLESLELQYVQELSKKDTAEEKIAELREELKDLVGDEGYTGRHLNMKWVTSRGATDWKEATKELVQGDLEVIEEYQERFRRKSSTKFTVTSNT